MVVLLGIWSLFQSLGTESVLKKALYAYTIYSAALTPVILAAFFWKRATAAAAVASIATGTVVTVAWDFITPHLPKLSPTATPSSLPSSPRSSASSSSASSPHPLHPHSSNPSQRFDPPPQNV